MEKLRLKAPIIEELENSVLVTIKHERLAFLRKLLLIIYQHMIQFGTVKEEQLLELNLKTL